MKHEYAGTTIELGAYVAIFDGDAAVPIFHASREPAQEGCSWFIRRARCGVAIFAQRDDEPYERHAIEIPARHAVRFGRPCLTCWPELRRQRSLFERPRRGFARDGSQTALADVEAVFADAGLTVKERL